jgi:hypothetical protein
MKMAQQKGPWPAFALPSARGALTPNTILAAPPGEARDEAIHAWTRSVWSAFAENRAAIEGLLRRCGIIS